MRKKILSLVCIATFIYSTLSFCQDSLLKKNIFLPKENKKILIIGQDKETILGYLRTVKIEPSGFMVYTSLRGLEGLDSQVDYGSGIQYAEYFTEHYPKSILQIGLYLVGDLERINQGNYDKNIKKLADWCKKVKVPILLRIGYEFDYPANNYAPKQYAQAFRYIVDLLKRQDVTNVATVWHSAAVAKLPMQWYPGDDYVDWYAISYFDPNNKGNMTTMAKLSREHNKPLMIAEATPRNSSVTDGEKSWQNWFVPFFDFIKANDVKIVCYINSQWETLSMFKGQGWPNARIQDNGYIKKHWLEEIKLYKD